MFNSLRKQIQFIISANVFIILFIGFTAFFLLNQSTAEYRSAVDVLFYLNNLSDKAIAANRMFEEYIQDNDEKKLDDYRMQVQDTLNTTEEILSMLGNDETKAYAKGLKGMIVSYSNINEEIIKELEEENTLPFELLNENKRINANIINRIIKITSLEISDRDSRYKDFSKRVREYLFIFCLLTITIIAVIFIMSELIGESITKPIGLLVERVKKMSCGNVELDDLKVKGSREITTLVEAFNIMKNNIRNYINEIKEKTKLEARVKEQAVEKLQMKNALYTAELKSLQSQINPHFLFNTLNSIGRVAYFKGAHDLVELIEAVADMLRYNLRKIDQPVTIADEVNNLKNYIFIQRTRFGDKIDFEVTIGSKNMDTAIPCLTLQPIIENAIIHGFDSYGCGNKVSVKVWDMDDKSVEIEISDNGVGMEGDIIESFYSKDVPRRESGHSTGIGLKNVISRLDYFYKNSAVISFNSEIGRGTTVKIILPINKGGEDSV